MALHSGGTAADRIQSGSTAQRPSPEIGQIRFNTDTQDIEFYRGDRWVPVRPPVTDPISDTDRTIGLQYDRGLHLTGSNLETFLGKGLKFDSNGSIRVTSDEEVTLAYEPLVRSDLPGLGPIYNEVDGFHGNLSGQKVVRFNPPPESNAALAFATVKITLRPLKRAGMYEPDAPCSTYVGGNFFAMLGGRNCFASTAGVQERMGASFGGTCSFHSAKNGAGVDGPQFQVWIMKIEQLKWDINKTEDITMTFTWPSTGLGICRYDYGTVRAAMLPFQLSS